MARLLKNLLLISGSGRNVGKTSFIREVIVQNAGKRLVAIKITPHFHESTEGLIPMAVTENYRIYRETNTVSGKDSAMFLKAGAEKVFYIQTTDQHLDKAFSIATEGISSVQPIITESAALREFIIPGMYLFLRKADDAIKPAALQMMELADQHILSYGDHFSINPKTISFNQTWEINDIA